MSQPRHPRHISEAVDQSYLVHVERNLQLYQKKFSFRQTGDRAQAMREAVAWRDQLLAQLPPRQSGNHLDGYNKVLSVLKRPESGTRVGVSRLLVVRVTADGRRRVSVYFKVGWSLGRDAPPGHTTRVRNFYAGPVDTITEADERHAYLTALAFREHWEHSRDHRYLFNPALYRHWRTVTCYPFTATAGPSR
jgi:hypothetical protein